MKRSRRWACLLALIAMSQLALSAQPVPKTPDLADDWVYGGAQGRVQVKQAGNQVTLQLTWAPNSDPAPHYIVETTLASRSLDGTWRCVTRVCAGQGGKFHADLSVDGSRLTVSRTEDSGNNGWNRIVMLRAPKTAASMATSLKTAGAVEIYDILFDVDKASIKPESKPTLNEVAKLLTSDPLLRLEVAGHTDNTGSPQHNLALSQSRADAVVDAIVKDHGISPSRLQAKGYGDSKPAAPNNTEQNRANNRRVELRRL